VSTAMHLALKETWRNRGRFLLFGLVVALITVLVLFIAALGTGLLGGIREYLEGLNADLIVYQETARLVIESSRIGCEKRREVGRVEGVREAGPIGFSSVSIVADDGTELLDVSLIGVEPGKPGEPPVAAGGGLARKSAYEAIVDGNVARVMKLQVGDPFTIGAIQGKEEEFYTLRVVGISESLKYGLQPSVTVPIVTWDEIRPKAVASRGKEDPACNVVAVQLDDPRQLEAVRQRLERQVSDVEAVERTAAYEGQPGYTSIRTSLSTQNTFALLIGTLVIGGFFQIQTLQKVPQIGMLKAIGTPNSVVAVAAIIQIVAVTLLGVAVGSVVSLSLSLSLPPNIPIIFELRSGAMAVVSILLMGLVGGLVSIRYSLRVEPLIALGLGS